MKSFYKFFHRSYATYLLILMLIILSSCQKTFDYSVYSAKVPSEHQNSRAINFSKLDEMKDELNNADSFKIVLISDSHTKYDDLDNGIRAINEDPTIKFLIHGGDMTDGGMLREFLNFKSIIDKATQPYFTVIGNHDCLANGYGIYQDMFGPDDYSFTAGNCKFIFFNDVIWELEFREPDYFWLMDELADSENYNHVFVISHIAPFSDSFTPLQQAAFTSILDSNDVEISVHGHHHDHSFSKYYGDDVYYMTIGSIDKEQYVTLNILPDTVIMERIRF